MYDGRHEFFCLCIINTLLNALLYRFGNMLCWQLCLLDDKKKVVTVVCKCKQCFVCFSHMLN